MRDAPTLPDPRDARPHALACLMSGLVGIVAHARDASVSAQEIDALAADYESLRGAGVRVPAVGGSRARVTRFAFEDDGAVAPDAGVSWTLTSGAAHDLGASAAADLDDLDGQFAWMRYDAAEDVLTLASDPMGMQALYLAERDGKSYFSTSALVLARHLRTGVDRLGLEVFLRAGYQFGSLTPWQGVERVEPATRVSFRADGPQRSVYWRPTVDESLAGMNMAQTVEHCTAVASEALHARLGGKPRAWADLTCGYDTRLLTLLLREAGVDFEANTVGEEGSRDVRVAEQIARTCGWDWTRYEIPKTWDQVLPELLPLAVAWSDCHLNAVQLAEVLWGHREKARLHRSLLIGGGGEHFRHHAWQQEFLAAGKSKRVNMDNWIDMVMLWPMDTRVFAGDPTAAVREHLLASMTARAQPYSEYLNTIQLDVLHAYKTTGHLGAYRSAASAFMRAELPFYFKPLFNLSLSTSHLLRKKHELMRHMIEALDPRVAAFETTLGGPAQPQRLRNVHRYLPYYRTYARKATTKVSQRLIGRALLLPAHVPDSTRARARAGVVERLGEGTPLRARAMRCGALFDSDALDGLLARAGDPNLQETALLSRILTAELSLRAAGTGIDP